MKLHPLYRDECGATLVEFTVVLPLFLTLTFGIMQAGLMLWAQIGLQHGVETAARCASISDIARKHASLNTASNPTPCYNVDGDASANSARLKSYAASNSWGLSPPASVFSISTTSGNCNNGNLVTAAYPFSALQLFPSITLNAQSCYPRAT